MQNKPKLRKSQMNVNKLLTKDYENKTLGESGKNKPKTNPNKAKILPVHHGRAKKNCRKMYKLLDIL